MFVFFFGMLISLVTGALAISAFVSIRRWTLASSCFFTTASFGLSCGLSAMTYLCNLLFFSASRGTQILFDIFIFLLVAALWARWRKTPIVIFNIEEPEVLGRPWRVFQQAVVCQMLLVFSVFIAVVYLAPYADVDSIAIWMMKARALQSFSSDLMRIKEFDSLFHMDYPLLLPSLVARGCLWLGRSSQLPSIVYAYMFSLSMLAILYSFVFQFGGRKRALICVFILLSSPLFLRSAANQIADVPVSFFMFLSMTFVLRWCFEPEGRFWVWLAGFFAAAAAFTKNEGIAFFLLAPGVTFLLVGFLHGFKVAAKKTFEYLSGAAPLLLFLAWFKIFIAPANDLTLTRLSFIEALVERSLTVLSLMWDEILSYNHYGFLFLLIAAILLGWRADRKRLYLAAMFAILLLQHVAYFVVYIRTPYDVAWHIGTSYARLITQSWPLCLGIYFISVNDFKLESSQTRRLS